MPSSLQSSRLLLTQGVHNALIVSLYVCQPTLLASHQLLSLNTQSLSCQHWDPDKFPSHALNTISMLMHPKFTSPALTSPLGFGFIANSLQSNRYVKLNTFKTDLLVSSNSTPPHCVWQLTHLGFHAQNLRSQPQLLSFSHSSIHL